MILDPTLYKVSNENIYEWRTFLKLELLKKRKFRSDLSGKSLVGNCDMHEGILTRANVPKSIDWSWQIYHEFNCFLLLREEHIPLPPDREWCIQKAYQLYGKREVRDWYYELPFKIFPFSLP